MQSEEITGSGLSATGSTATGSGVGAITSEGHVCRFRNTVTIVENVLTAVRPCLPLTPAECGQRQGLHKSFSTVGKASAGFSGADARGRSSAPERQFQSVDRTLIYEVLRPFFVCMKVFGMFFVRLHGDDLYRTSSDVGGASSRQRRIGMIYCVVVTAVLAFNTLRSIVEFRSNGNDILYVLTFKFVWIVFLYEGLSRIALVNFMCYRRNGGLAEVFFQIETGCYTDGIIPYEASLRRIMYSILASTIVAVLFVGAVYVYGFYSDNGDLVGIFDVLLVPKSGSSDDIVNGIVLLFVLWNTAVSMLYLGFFGLVCYILYKEFEYLGRTFEMKIGQDGSFTDDLERFRIAHQRRYIYPVALVKALGYISFLI